MSIFPSTYRLLPVQAFTLAIVLVGLFLIWEVNVDFSLANEGYLWYEVQRVLLDEVPIRDFTSYDPGRYFWFATLMTLNSQHGSMDLCTVVTVFQVMTLGIGLLLVVRSQKNKNFFYVLLSGVILVAWMFLRHKLFDISFSLLAGFWTIGIRVGFLPIWLLLLLIPSFATIVPNNKRSPIITIYTPQEITP